MSLSGAGEVVQLEQMGASHVPLLRSGTRQSHSSVAGRPHLQRFALRRGPHTIAETPFGNVTRSHFIGGARAMR